MFGPVGDKRLRDEEPQSQDEEALEEMARDAQTLVNSLQYDAMSLPGDAENAGTDGDTARKPSGNSKRATLIYTEGVPEDRPSSKDGRTLVAGFQYVQLATQKTEPAYRVVYESIKIPKITTGLPPNKKRGEKYTHIASYKDLETAASTYDALCASGKKKVERNYPSIPLEAFGREPKAYDYIKEPFHDIGDTRVFQYDPDLQLLIHMVVFPELSSTIYDYFFVTKNDTYETAEGMKYAILFRRITSEAQSRVEMTNMVIWKKNTEFDKLPPDGVLRFVKFNREGQDFDTLDDSLATFNLHEETVVVQHENTFDGHTVYLAAVKVVFSSFIPALSKRLNGFEYESSLFEIKGLENDDTHGYPRLEYKYRGRPPSAPPDQDFLNNNKLVEFFKDNDTSLGITFREFAFGSYKTLFALCSREIAEGDRIFTVFENGTILATKLGV